MKLFFTYLVRRGQFLAELYVTLLHIGSVRALFGRNLGQVITHLVGRGASWGEYVSSCYIFGRYGAFFWWNIGQTFLIFE